MAALENLGFRQKASIKAVSVLVANDALECMYAVIANKAVRISSGVAQTFLSLCNFTILSA